MRARPHGRIDPDAEGTVASGNPQRGHQTLPRRGQTAVRPLLSGENVGAQRRRREGAHLVRIALSPDGADRRKPCRKMRGQPPYQIGTGDGSRQRDPRRADAGIRLQSKNKIRERLLLLIGEQIRHDGGGYRPARILPAIEQLKRHKRLRLPVRQADSQRRAAVLLPFRLLQIKNDAALAALLSCLQHTCSSYSVNPPAKPVFFIIALFFRRVQPLFSARTAEIFCSPLPEMLLRTAPERTRSPVCFPGNGISQQMAGATFPTDRLFPPDVSVPVPRLPRRSLCSPVDFSACFDYSDKHTGSGTRL